MKKNNLNARLKEWEALKAEGGTQRTKMVRNGFGKLDAFHRPGSQKK